MRDKTIPDSAKPRLESFSQSLESFYPPFHAGVDLSHQCVVDCYIPPFVSGIGQPDQDVVDFYNFPRKA